MTQLVKTQTDENALMAEHPILLYDGVCALCNGLVRFVLRHDRAGRIRFAALESEVATRLLGEQAHTEEGVALVLQPFSASQMVLRRSDAVIALLRAIGWRTAGALLAITPRPLRETGYAVVARVRYRLFGRYAACPLPPPEVRSRFLDR
jgi:predicted DCC family thiol-disulfide oxidoreductase YuxK